MGRSVVGQFVYARAVEDKRVYPATRRGIKPFPQSS
jgi:hypothetical protein